MRDELDPCMRFIVFVCVRECVCLVCCYIVFVGGWLCVRARVCVCLCVPVAICAGTCICVHMACILYAALEKCEQVCYVYIYIYIYIYIYTLV